MKLQDFEPIRVKWETQYEAYLYARELIRLRSRCKGTDLDIYVSFCDDDDSSYEVTLKIPKLCGLMKFVGFVNTGKIVPSPYMFEDYEVVSLLQGRKWNKCKCEKCNREIKNASCYVFLDGEGNIHTFGRECVTDMFGIEITAKAQIVLGELMEFLMNKGGVERSNLNGFDAMMLSTCMVYAEHGKSIRFNEFQGEYQKNISDAIGILSGRGTCDNEAYRKFLHLMIHGYQFFKDYNRVTDWSVRVSDAGTRLLDGCAIPKKDHTYMASMAKWCAATFCGRYYGDEPGKYHLLNPFEGGRVIEGTVHKIVPRKNQAGGIFYSILAITRYKNLVWFDVAGVGPYKIGKYFKISAFFGGYSQKNPAYAKLNNVYYFPNNE